MPKLLKTTLSPQGTISVVLKTTAILGLRRRFIAKP